MDRTRITREALEVKCQGKGPIKQPETRQFSQALEDIKNRGKSWQEIKRINCGGGGGGGGGSCGSSGGGNMMREGEGMTVSTPDM
jgi:hypothetical protein